MNVALLTAAGSGTRMHQEIPKQFLHVQDKPLIVHTMERFQVHPSIDAICVVTLPAWAEVLKAYARQFGITKLRWVENGGATGQESIHNGLVAIAKDCTDDVVVMIHDGNRCLVSQQIISDSLSTFAKHGSAVAAIPCVEVVFRSEDGRSSSDSIPREQLWRTQTPHTFKLGDLLWAHDEASRLKMIDTAATCDLMWRLGRKVWFSLGSEENLKVTTQDDLHILEALLSMR